MGFAFPASPKIRSKEPRMDIHEEKNTLVSPSIGSMRGVSIDGGAADADGRELAVAKDVWQINQPEARVMVLQYALATQNENAALRQEARGWVLGHPS